MQMLNDILIDATLSFKRCVTENMIGFTKVLNMILPFVMLFIGARYSQSNSLFMWGLLPAIVLTSIWLIQQVANRIGKGLTIPLPQKRFTECESDGQVNVEYYRLQELILYTADLEDWLKRNCLTKE